MARAVAEWIGATPDTAIPDRVKLRILARQDDRCEGCTRKFDGKLKPVFDHRPALINGGQNRESMIEAVCTTCHTPRTRADVAEKSKVAAIQRKHKLPKEPSRGFRRPDGYKHNWRTGRLEKIT